jgi:hypothetical protein
MRHEPSLTFRGALAILGHREHRVIERLDNLPGGVILAGGGGAGIAAVGPPAVAPLGTLGAVWGWLEQRDEALRLLRTAIDSERRPDLQRLRRARTPRPTGLMISRTRSTREEAGPTARAAAFRNVRS